MAAHTDSRNANGGRSRHSLDRLVRRWRRNAKSFDSVAQGSVEMGHKDLAETYRMIAQTYRDNADELRVTLQNSANTKLTDAGTDV